MALLKKIEVDAEYGIRFGIGPDDSGDGPGNFLVFSTAWANRLFRMWGSGTLENAVRELRNATTEQKVKWGDNIWTAKRMIMESCYDSNDEYITPLVPPDILERKNQDGTISTFFILPQY